MGTITGQEPENLDTLFNFVMADPELRTLFINKTKQHLPNIFAEEAAASIFASTPKRRQSRPSKKTTPNKKAPSKDRGLTDQSKLREGILAALKNGPKNTPQIKAKIGGKIDSKAYSNAISYLKETDKVMGKKNKGSIMKTWELKK